MKTVKFSVLLIFLFGLTGYVIENNQFKIDESRILGFEVDPIKQDLDFYWKNKNGEIYMNFQNLKSQVNRANKKLIFAVNGGMYNKDLSPQGLYIENGIEKAKLDTMKVGYGNFYLQPNGVFYLSKNNIPVVCSTDRYVSNENVKYATQSGPMLLIEGEIHPKFNIGSANVHIRNGVGILPNGNLLFAMSKEKINFFDFASYFKKNGCENALYLDGFVSRTYLPSKNYTDLDGKFGVIIGVTEVK